MKNPSPFMYHVLPVNDEREHEEEGTMCWCNPTVHWTDPETGEPFAEALVVHNASDGRELIEEAERLKMSIPRSISPDGQPYLHNEEQNEAAKAAMAKEMCNSCLGSGTDLFLGLDGEENDCPDCNGTGRK